MIEGLLSDAWAAADATHAPKAYTEATGSSSVSRPEPGDIVLVTGASGFVGAAIVRRLQRTGCRIRTLMRPTSLRANVEDLGIDICTGDIRDPVAVASAMKGARWLFHAAADYRLWALDPSEILDCNLRGTEIVLEAALAAGVEKIVYTSSVATLTPCHGGSPSCEMDRLAPDDAIGAYKYSKVLAELLVDHMVNERGLPAVVVHPSTPIGPGDIKPTPTGRIVVEAACGRIPAFVETGLNLVHVDDVADGHLRALERGRIGERYILGGQDVGFGTMLADIAAITGRRAPKLRLPHNAIYPFAYAAEAVARVTGREPFVSLDSLRMSKHLMFYSSRKAEDELGYRARPYLRALEDALDYFATRRYVPAFGRATNRSKGGSSSEPSFWRSQ